MCVLNPGYGPQLDASQCRPWWTRSGQSCQKLVGIGSLRWCYGLRAVGRHRRLPGRASRGCGEMTGQSIDRELPPWAQQRGQSLRLTVDEVRRRCRSLRSTDTPPTRSYGFSNAHIRPSAALLPVVAYDGEAAVLVTKRAASMRLHPDEWVFPGGTVDTDRDEDPIDTALREFEEELGVPRRSVELLGQLATYGPFVTGYLLHMFVGVLRDTAAIRPNPSEVADILVVPLSRLTQEGAYLTGPLPPSHDPGPDRAALARRRSARRDDIRFFRVKDDEHMWGTQGDVLWDFLSLLCTTGMELEHE